MARTGRTSRGRQRIEMTKIKNESNLQVTFSKRRAGLFKKANELVTLCGADLVLIVFSPGGKVFSYGSPNVETIIERYINPNPAHPNNADRLVDPHRANTIEGLNAELTNIEQMLDYAKEYAEVIDRRWKSSPIKIWLETPIDDLSPKQLQDLAVAMESLLKDVKERKSIVQNMFDSRHFGGGFMFSHNFGASGASSSSIPHGFDIANMFPYNLRASGSGGSSMSHGLDISPVFPRASGGSSSTMLPQNFMASGSGGSYMSHGLDIAPVFPRASGGSSFTMLPSNFRVSGAGSSDIAGMLPRAFGSSSSSMPHGLDISAMVPHNPMTSGTGSSSMSHGFDITNLFPKISESASSTISHGFDIAAVLPQNPRTSETSTSNISHGFDLGFDHGNV